MKNTIARGSEAELIVATKAVSLGYTVSFPISHSSQYDLIIDSGKLNRIQVKRAYRVCDRGKAALCVETRRVLVRHSGNKGSVAKQYEDNSYDWLIAIDCETSSTWVIPHTLAQTYKAQIRLETERILPYKNNWSCLG
jgi:hypothetical protein